MKDKKLYKYLKSVAKNILLLDEEEYKYHKSDEYSYKSVLKEEKKFYRGYLNQFLTSEKYYKYINEIIDNKEANIRIAYIANGDLCGVLNISLIDLMLAINNNRSRLNEFEKERFDNLTKKIKIENFSNEIKNDYYSINVEGEEITLKSLDILKIFLLDENEFIKTINKKEILGIYNKKFAYILENFLNDNNIIQRFILSTPLIIRYHNIKKHKYIDYQTINYFESKESNTYDAKISEKLKQDIYKGMNLDYSDLEKAIYIYIKLCKKLSYDPVFFASNQRGEIAQYHQNIERLATIEGTDDLIVCYEFNAIYSEFLKELGIEHNINVRSVEDDYGKAHANLNFRIEDYLVSADAVTSIIRSDLVNAKIDAPLNGLKCLNMSEKTQANFTKLVEKIYNDLIGDYSDYQIGQLLTIYRAFNDENECSLETKLDVFFDEINNTQLKTMDALGYLSALKKVMFTKKELSENISFLIVKSNLNDVVNPIVIATLNEKENINESENNKYYCYIPGEDYHLIEKKELENYFMNSDFQYMDDFIKRIPGINLSKSKRK